MSQIYEEEKNYLNTVNNLIEKEIEETTIQYHETSKTKLSWEDRRRGDEFTKAAMMDFFDARIKKLKFIAPSPYFGRMDFTEEFSDEVNSIYVGKTLIMDENNKLVVIDWRSPVSSMYYDSSVGKSSYVAPQGVIQGIISLKRQFVIEKSELKKVFDTDLVSSDEILQQYLDVHADSRMKNIVASIQQEQNKVIRYDNNKNIIVQGIAGSGKTSVALHRIAYLIYLLNNSEANKTSKIKSNQFMIIGPNSYFLDYISSVLPDLDVENANQLTIADLVSDLVKEKITIIDQSEELQNYFKDGTTKQQSQIKNSEQFEEALNKYIEDIYNYYLSTDIIFNDTVIFDKETIKSHLSGKKGNYLGNILSLEKNLITRIKQDVKEGYDKFEDLLTKDIREKIKKLPQDSEVRMLLFDKISLIRAELKTGLSKVIKTHFAAMTKGVLHHYINFISNLDRYIKFEDIDQFKESTLKRLSRKKLARDDIAPMLLLTERLIPGSEYNDIVHIVIDEAQDLGLLEFKILKKLFPKAVFSIFGDLNQSVFSYRSVENWESVKTEAFGGNCDVFELNQSYRTTDEIMKEANKVSEFLTGKVSDEVVRHGAEVDYKQFSIKEIPSNIKVQIEKFLAKGYKSIAIITKTEIEAKKLNTQLQAIGINIPNVTSDDKKYNGGLCTIASSLSKGLEFDATLLVNVNSDIYDVDKDIDMKLLYVAMTRALHETNIIYTNELPSVLTNRKIKVLTKN